MSATETLSRYVDELLAGHERPLQEYLLENPEQRDELVPLLVGALAIHNSIRGIDLLAAREEQSRKRSLEALAKVLAEKDDLTEKGALTRFVEKLREAMGGGKEE